ncbi:hypothetical protein E6W39_13620 [Kitasatospora acidiphila]|uniref:Gram-positive cocci surface proteins LPxTG domain-containing protein n=1 Tax=Kitasatospora acidiphila TaxID=2567942 RepID=A0A540W263_9ACTN|nr:hypothetical protein [Kitasatospora acidiphila]TQF03101.1 hypothetical protein E6W39_13620 [Kitasatospora acidiphila]
MAGVVTFAGVASAHIPDYTRDCTSFTLNLHYYPDGAEANWVTVTVNGKDIVTHHYFSGVYNPAPFAAKPTDTVTFHVHTKDDPDEKNHQWSGDFTVSLDKPCPQPPTTAPPTTAPPTTQPPTTAPPTTAPPTTPASTTPAPTTPAPTTPAATTPAAAVPTPSATPTKPSLAYTGGGSDAGLIAGVGAGVVVVGGGLVFMSRRRAAGRHN